MVVRGSVGKKITPCWLALSYEPATVCLNRHASGVAAVYSGRAPNGVEYFKLMFAVVGTTDDGLLVCGWGEGG